MVRRPFPPSTGPFTAVLGLLALSGVPGCSDVSVNVLPVVEVEVTPSELTLLEGEAGEVEVILRGADGEELAAHTLTWTSDDPAVATVDDGGRIRGESPGTTQVRASAQEASASVAVTVLQGPTLGLSTRSVRFRGEAGGAAPKETELEVENTGHGTLTGLDVSVTTEDPGGPPWLGATLSRTSAPATLLIRARFDGLEPGIHVGAVAVTAQGRPDAPQLVDVEFIVDEPPPQVQLTPPSVGLSAVAGSREPAVQVVAVTNRGGLALTEMEASITYPEGEPGGWLEAELEAGTAPTTLALRALARNLGPGVHRAEVQVSSPVAGAQGAVLQVRFDVSAPPASAGWGR